MMPDTIGQFKIHLMLLVRRMVSHNAVGIQDEMNVSQKRFGIKLRAMRRLIAGYYLRPRCLRMEERSLFDCKGSRRKKCRKKMSSRHTGRL